MPAAAVSQSLTRTDASFGNGGTVTTAFGGLNGASDVAVQPDGKIVAAGSVYSPYPRIDDFALARYNADGSLDASFGTGGKVTTDFGGIDGASGLAIQADGKIVAAGAGGASNDFALARYNPDGSLDASFGTGGKVTTDFGSFDAANGLAIQADGKIVVAGVGGEHFALARYDADGSLDASFGTGGKVTTRFSGENIESARAVALQADQRIVAVGSAFFNYKEAFALARYNADGTLDISFGNGGKVTTGFGASNDGRGQAVAIQADGKIVGAGAGGGPCSPPCDFALARYLRLPTVDLATTKSDGTANATPGQGVTYTIVISNSEPNAAIGATVTDTVPPALMGVTWTCVGTGGGSCTASGSGNISDAVTLLIGSTVTYNLTGTISACAQGSLSNTATVMPPVGQTDLNLANNSETDTDTLTPQADLGMTKTDGQAAVVPGQGITYTIVASNAGPSCANGATVTDTVPGAITGATWTCVGAGGGSCTANGSGNINDTVNLPVGASVTYTLGGTLSPSATGSLSNTASVAAPGGVTEPVPGNNSATDTDVIVCGADALAVPDGRATASVVPANESLTLGASVRIGNSYSVAFRNITGITPPGTLAIFSGDDACGGPSTVTVSETSGIDPVGIGGLARVSFRAGGSGNFFRAKLVNGTGSSIPISFSWSDTTMFSPAWSDNGSFDTFYSFLNSTGTPLHGTLTLLDPAGAVVTTLNVGIPVGQTATTNTAALGIARNRTGTARFTHDGPPGAIIVEAAIANFSISPAYVQPVKFQTVREAH